MRERADVVLKRRYVQQRLIPNAMEPRAVVVTPLAASGEYTVYSATQIPHILADYARRRHRHPRVQTARDRPRRRRRLLAPASGVRRGGPRPTVARRLGWPCEWTESRSEGYLATHHGRGMIQDIEIAATSEGRLLGLKFTSSPTWAPI